MKMKRRLGVFLILSLVLNLLNVSITFANDLKDNALTDEIKNNSIMFLAYQENDFKAISVKDETKILTQEYKPKNSFIYVKDGHTYTTSAFDFHIFSKKSILNAHTNGNIATKALYANNHIFGTNQSATLNLIEENYFMNSVDGISQISSDGNIILGHKIITQLVDNNNKLKIGTNSGELSQEKTIKVYKETEGSINYINIDQEFENLKIVSRLLSNNKTSPGVILSNVNGENQSITIDGSIGSSDNYYLNISGKEINDGINKRILNINIPENKTLIINVDMAGLNINYLQNLVTIINNYSNSEEVVKYNNNVLWNLYDSSSANGLFNTDSEYAMVGTRDYFMGTILAPNANIKYGAVNGSIIANETIQNYQESHKWNFTGHQNYIDPEDPVTQEVSVTIEGTKVLEGKELISGMFSFELLDESGKVLQTVTNDANGSIKFETINYDKVGTYKYKVREVNGTLEGISYDEKEFEVIVNVSDDGNGQLEAEVNYPNKQPIFTNSYKANSITVDIDPKKTLTGKILEKDMFEFELLDENNNVLETVKNEADGSIKFSGIKFSEAGVYNYKIHEVKGTLEGIIYDLQDIDVVITVKDKGNGQLEAEVNYPNKKPEFSNIYKAKSTNATIEGTNILEGNELISGMFSFELLDENGEVLQTVKNEADGTIKFEAINYDEEGEYKYKVREVKGNLDELIYDEGVFDVIVIVTDNGEGNLVATVTYPENKIVFKNKILKGSLGNSQVDNKDPEYNESVSGIMFDKDEVEHVNSITTPNTGDTGVATILIFELLSIGGLVLINKKR